MRDVNLLIEDCFFIDVGAFRECFVRFFASRNSAGQVPKKKNPRVPLRSSGQAKGQAPSLRGFYSQSLVAF
jgi:hypothetical protein